MAGMRISLGEWGTLTTRDEPFRNFDLSSYEQGRMDCTILARPVVPMTMADRIEQEQQIETLQDVASLVALGMSETDAVKRLRDREAAQIAAASRAAGFAQ